MSNMAIPFCEIRNKDINTLWVERLLYCVRPRCTQYCPCQQHWWDHQQSESWITFTFPFTKHHKIKSIFRTRGKSIPRTISFPIVQCTYRDGTIGLNRVATVQKNAYYSSMKLHNTFHVILRHEPTCSGSTCIYFLFLILSHQNQQKRQISSDKNTQI